MHGNASERSADAEVLSASFCSQLKFEGSDYPAEPPYLGDASMPGPIAAYQLRRFDPALADGPIAKLIGGDTNAWQTHTAYPLNSDMLVCGPLAVVAVNSRVGATSVYWRGEMHDFGTGNPNDALRRFWNAPEFQPRPRPKADTADR